MPKGRPAKKKAVKMAKSPEIASAAATSVSPVTPSSNKKTYLIVGIVVVAFLVYLVRNQLIVATVNGQPIDRLALISELEKQGGKRTLDTLITKMLILQEATKEKVTVSDQEIKDEEQKLKDNFAKQGQNLQQLLDAQNMSQQEFYEQIKLQKIVEKIAGRDIVVTDQEINSFIEKNAGLFPKDANMEEEKKNVQEQLKQEKLGEKVQGWLKNLRDKANVQYFRFAPSATPTAAPTTAISPTTPPAPTGN